MAREYAIVTSKFWTGETGRAIRKNADAQRVALYLITAPTSNMIGLYYLPLPTLCHEIGISPEGASKALRRLSDLGFAHYDAPSEWVWVPEMAAHQLGDSLKPKDKRISFVMSLLREARKSPFCRQFWSKYGAPFCLPAIDFSEGPSKPPRSQDQEQDQDKEQEQEQEQEGGEPPNPPLPSLPPSIRTPAMTEAVADWLTYKRERRESYKPTGLKNFYTHLSNAVAQHGEAVIIDRLRKAMASNWKGWDHPDAPARGSPRSADDPRGTLAAMNAYLNGNDR